MVKVLNDLMLFNDDFWRDTLENKLEKVGMVSTNYPPTDVYREINSQDGKTFIELALAGFSKDEILIKADREKLLISAKKKKKEEKDYITNGIAKRQFDKEFKLNYIDYYYEITDYSFIDGILKIALDKKAPDNPDEKIYEL